ncbi:MAG TPA: hypothetical protein VML54_06700 [Candidatus Limnocylindrales bacterium]|nr:hypothetical protein [Candidatus Limnocylindrales bacterium]
MARPLALPLALLLSAPAALSAQAQQEAPPPVLSISSYVCPQSTLAEIRENYEKYTIPVEREMVQEGQLLGAGIYFHAWSDEWNFNYYRVASGIDALMAAVAEVGRRVNEANPELANQPGPFAACTAHKDNIYFMGPTTGNGG